MDSKICNKCQFSKPLSQFHLKKDAPLGRNGRCKECISEYTKSKYHADPEGAKARSRKWAIENQGRRQQYCQDYEAANAERRRDYLAVYHANNVELCRLRVQRWAAANRDTTRARMRQYARTHKTQYLAAWHRRKALLIGNGGSHTPEEWQALCAHFGNKCLRCGCVGALTVDHVVPISKGGTNDIGNLQPLCLACNVSKGAKYIDYRAQEGG